MVANYDAIIIGAGHNGLVTACYLALAVRARYRKSEAMVERVPAVFEPTLTMPPPNVLRPGVVDLWKLFKLSRAFRKLGAGMSEALEILMGPARPILDRWFESEQLKV